MNHLKNNSGLTLIEILVAALIVAGGMIAYGLATGNVTHQNAQSKKKSIAVTLAQDKIEFIKNTASTVSLAGADTLDSPTESSGTWNDFDSESWTAAAESATGESARFAFRTN